MKLTKLQLEHLARELRSTAGGVDMLVETLEEAGTPSLNYSDDSLTVQLAVLLDVAAA